MRYRRARSLVHYHRAGIRWRLEWFVSGLLRSLSLSCHMCCFWKVIYSSILLEQMGWEMIFTKYVGTSFRIVHNSAAFGQLQESDGKVAGEKSIEQKRSAHSRQKTEERERGTRNEMKLINLPMAMPLQLLLNVKLTEPSFIFNLTIFLKLHSRLFSTWPTRDERRNVITKREISIFWSKEKRVTESIWIQLYNSILNAVFLFGSRALAEEMEKNDRRARGFHLFAAVLFLLLSPHFVFTFASSLLAGVPVFASLKLAIFWFQPIDCERTERKKGRE